MSESGQAQIQRLLTDELKALAAEGCEEDFVWLYHSKGGKAYMIARLNVGWMNGEGWPHECTSVPSEKEKRK